MAAGRRDELTAEELPPTWTHRAFKDPVACQEELFQKPARTPCEAAWRVKAYRGLVLEWLVESGGGGRRSLILATRMPDGSMRFALFLRELRLVLGARLVVVRDALSATVFAGRQTYANEPVPPAPRSREQLLARNGRKARPVRRKAGRQRRK